MRSLPNCAPGGPTLSSGAERREGRRARRERLELSVLCCHVLCCLTLTLNLTLTSVTLTRVTLTRVTLT